MKLDRFTKKNKLLLKESRSAKQARDREYARTNRNEWEELGMVTISVKIPASIKDGVLRTLETARADHMVELVENSNTLMSQFMAVARRNKPKLIGLIRVQEYVETLLSSPHKKDAQLLLSEYKAAVSHMQLNSTMTSNEDDQELALIAYAKEVAWRHKAAASANMLMVLAVEWEKSQLPIEVTDDETHEVWK